MFFATKSRRHKELFKQSLVTLLLVTCSFASIGQVSFGVKGGINVNEIASKEIPTSFAYLFETEASIGFHFGLFTKLKLGKKFDLIPELQFSQRGYKIVSGGTKSNLNIGYLELPILLSYSIKFLSIEIGPNISYRITSTVDAYKDFDFGLNGGIRVKLTDNFFASSRYYYGISAISEFEFRDVNNQFLGKVTEHNRTIQIGIGYIIK
jgi:Outer membrane protein beta-barrel domain